MWPPSRRVTLNSVTLCTVTIAIVGVGCRYPGADSIDELWSLLTEQRESVAEVPADRWDIDVYYDPDPKAAGRMTTRRAGFLRNVDQFDPHYFGISPREAAALDPQQRLLLETTVEALDAAAIPADRLATTLTGVFVGVSTNDYGRLMWADGVDKADPYSATGGALNAVPGRIAFTLGSSSLAPTSMPRVGSSRNTTRGSVIRALPMTTFC